MFLIFVVVLALVALVNIFSSHLLAMHQQRLGVVARDRRGRRRADPVLRPATTHASLGTVFTDTVNNTGSSAERPAARGSCFYVLPLSAILTQYTITGYDASAHLSEETQERGQRRGQGHLAVDLLLGHRRLDPAAVVPLRGAGRGRRHRGRRRRRRDLQPGAEQRTGPASSCSSRRSASSSAPSACMTSTTRMLFAFSRDGAVPGRQTGRS